VTTAADVRRAARYAARTQDRSRNAAELLAIAITRAFAAGVPAQEIVTASGLSRARVYQIRDAHREPSDPLPTVTP
jgi:hypothetical protein